MTDRELKKLRILQTVFFSKEKDSCTKKEIRQIEKFYGEICKNNKWDEHLDVLIAKDAKISELISRCVAVENELYRLYGENSGIQGGLVNECISCQTTARTFNLDNYLFLRDDLGLNLDIFPSYIQEEILDGGRHLYYNSEKTIFLIQCGSPDKDDAILWFENTRYVLEIKERNAKAGEYDLTYDEDGKLLCRENERNKKVIETIKSAVDYFETHSAGCFNQIGKNYKGFSEETINNYLKKYFENKDFVVISDCNNELVFVATEDVSFAEEDWKIFNFSGSEIRICGRNNMVPFTPLYMRKSFKENNVVERNTGEFFLPEISAETKNYCYRKGRGQGGKITGIKIGRVFFVRKRNMLDVDGGYIVKEADIRQLIPTFSVHMKLTKTKNGIYKKMYKDKIEKEIGVVL